MKVCLRVQRSSTGARPRARVLAASEIEETEKTPKLSPGRLLLEASGLAQPCMNEGR